MSASLKERIADLFAKHNVELSVEETAEKMAVATLENGQEIQTDAEAFQAGASVFVVNDEGERIPLPDGDYTLDGGSTLSVVDGVVAEQATAEPEEEEQLSAEEPVVEEEVSEVLTKDVVAAMIAEAVSATKADFSEQVKAMAEQVETQKMQLQKFSEQAAEKPVAKTPQRTRVDFSELKNLTTKQRVALLSKQFT